MKLLPVFQVVSKLASNQLGSKTNWKNKVPIEKHFSLQFEHLVLQRSVL